MHKSLLLNDGAKLCAKVVAMEPLLPEWFDGPINIVPETIHLILGSLSLYHLATKEQHSSFWYVVKPLRRCPLL